MAQEMTMKVKNMGQEHQSTYLKRYAFTKKKLLNGFITGGLSLILAIVGALFKNTVVICIFSAVSLILSGGETVSRLIKSTKKGKFDDGVFILLAVLVPFILGRFSIAAIAMAIYKLSSVLILFISGRLGKSFQEIADVLPQYANLVDSGSNIRKVYSESLTNGAKIMVKTGETVPVDCVISDGFSDFDTSNVYESEKNVSLSSGDKVLAGFINTGTSVTCEAVCDYDESLVMDLNRLASMAETKSTKGEQRFLTIARWYPLAVLAVAVAALLIGGFAKGAWTLAMLRVSVLFIVATTSSYIIAVPLLSSCAVWNLKKKGLALATGDLIDEIADINCVAFEKNGILTDGIFKIKDIYTAEGISEEDFLMIAANCIGGRQHPISKILTKYMNQYIPAENVIEFPGKGVECTIMGKSFLCGSETFMAECSIDVSELTGYSIYVSIDGVIMGAMLIQDLIKPNSGETLRKLRQTGVEKIVMFSSERKETAELAYIDCGADEYYADLSPYGRVEAIQNLQKDDEVTLAYVGDRVMGEQALDTANVGLTLISKTDSGLEYAKAVLLGDLETLAEAIEISRLTCGKIELHFYCASAVKIILALLGLFGAINIAAAIVIEALLTLVALFSAKDLIKK